MKKADGLKLVGSVCTRILVEWQVNDALPTETGRWLKAGSGRRTGFNLNQFVARRPHTENLFEITPSEPA